MADTDVATAVAQLLAFSKEPVRHRARLTHGREVIPGGLHVFRLAQGRFPQGLLRDLPAVERERIRQAAIAFIRQVCFWDGATHYQVLCVEPDARVARIKEHYQALIALIHPDRQDADSPHWPPEAAQRVNRAYEVLSDEDRRREYEVGVSRSAAVSPAEIDALLADRSVVEMPARTTTGAGSTWLRVRRHALPVLLILAFLFYLQMWWAARAVVQEPGPESQASVKQYYGWTRGLFSGDLRPRFLGGSPAPASGSREPRRDEARGESDGVAARLLRAFAGPTQAPLPVTREPPPGATKPSSQPGQQATAVPIPRGPSAAAEGMPAPAVAEAGPSRAVDGGRAPAAQTTGPASGRPAPGGGQTVGSSAAAPKAAATDEIEVLLVRLVAFYEKGDLDNLLLLFDESQVGFWERRRLREDFDAFFRDTRSRRLTVEWIRWEGAEGGLYRAIGQATLRAEYFEPGKVVERALPIELRARVVPGGLLLAGLSLFPHERPR